MGEVSTVGIDLAKSVFQVHGSDPSGAVIFRKKLRRDQVLSFFSTLPRCVVAMEACASAHYWAREIAAVGHDTRLIPPAYVKPLPVSVRYQTKRWALLQNSALKHVLKGERQERSHRPFRNRSNFKNQSCLAPRCKRGPFCNVRNAQLRWGGRPLTASMCHSGGVENTTEGGVHG